MHDSAAVVHVDDKRFKALRARSIGFWAGAWENSLLRATAVHAGSEPVKLPQSDGSYIRNSLALPEGGESFNSQAWFLNGRVTLQHPSDI